MLLSLGQKAVDLIFWKAIRENAHIICISWKQGLISWCELLPVRISQCLDRYGNSLEDTFSSFKARPRTRFHTFRPCTFVHESPAMAHQETPERIEDYKKIEKLIIGVSWPCASSSCWWTGFLAIYSPFRGRFTDKDEQLYEYLYFLQNRITKPSNVQDQESHEIPIESTRR